MSDDEKKAAELASAAFDMKVARLIRAAPSEEEAAAQVRRLIDSVADCCMERQPILLLVERQPQRPERAEPSNRGSGRRH